MIDHGPLKVATFYQHLEKLLVTETANAKSGERVRAGQPIGVIGADPLDGEHLKHLHFEFWRGGPKDAIDPAPLMRAWETVGDPNALVARNAGFTYRPIGASGESYPEWVRSLKGKAGVYVIRDAKSGEIVYVGSSSRRLYETLTRHFQTVAPLQRLLAWPIRRRPRPGADLRPRFRRGRRSASRRRIARSTRRCG